VYVLTAADIAYLLPKFPKINDIGLFPHLIAIGFTIVVFAVVFDTAFLFRDHAVSERLGTLRRRWLLALGVYGVTLAICVPLLVRIHSIVLV